jgi:hypothetical protein
VKILMETSRRADSAVARVVETVVAADMVGRPGRFAVPGVRSMEFVSVSRRLIPGWTEPVDYSPEANMEVELVDSSIVGLRFVKQ